jgi:serine/threonine protein kinase
MIFLQFSGGGSISTALGRFGTFSEAVIRRYTAQILSGLAYLHRNGIVHRDLKGSNILLHDGVAQLADFGTAVQKTDWCGLLLPNLFV